MSTPLHLRSLKTKQLLPILAALIALAFLPQTTHAAAIVISSSQSWSAITGGSGPGGVPNASDTVEVRGGATLTVDVSDAACLSVQLGGTTASSGAGTLLFNSGSELTVSGTVQIGGGGTGRTGSINMTSGGTLIANALSVSQAGTWTPGSGTVQLAANNTLPTSFFTSFNNLAIASGTTTLGANLAINGNLSVSSGAQLTVGAFTIGVTGTTTLDGTLSITSTSGTKTFTGNVTINSGGVLSESVAEQLDFGGDVTINTGGTLTEFGAAAVNIAGNFQNDGTYTPSTGTHTFSGTGKTLSGSSGLSFSIVTISGFYTLAANLAVSGTCTVNSGARLDCVNYVVSGGTFTLSSGGTLGIGSPAGIAASGATGNIQTTTRSFSTGANYVYNGTAAQVTGDGLPATVSSLAIKNTSAVVTLGGNVTVSTTLTIDAGGNLDGSDKTITLTASGTPLVVNGTFIPSTSTVAYTSTATAAANVTGVDYYNLTVNGNGAGDTFTATGNIGVANVLTIGTGNTATFNASSYTITLSGSGTPLVVNGTFTPSTSTVRYTSGSGATVTAPASGYNNLTIAGSGTFALGGSPTVAGTLSLTSGALSIGANTLTINGAISTTSGTLTGGASSSITVGGSGASTTLPAVTLNNLTVNRAAGLAVASGVNVNGTLTLTSGQVTSAGNLTLGNGANISRATGSLDSGVPTFSGTVNVTYTTGGVTTGTELPTSTGNVLQALSFNNTSGTVTLGGNATVNGALIIASGGTVADNGNVLTVKSTVSNSGTHSSTGSGKMVFAGGSAQSFAGSANGYGNVELNNANGTSISAATTINGNLTVTAGTFTVGAFALTVGGLTTIDSTVQITSNTGTKIFGGITINGTWNNSGNAAIQVKGNFVNNGTFTQGTQT